MSPPLRPGGCPAPPSPSPSRTPGPEPLPSTPGTEPPPGGGGNPGSSPGRGHASSDLALLLAASLALIVPGWLASPSASRPSLSGTCEAPRRIDVNSSPWYEWTLLDGIGEARARRIVEARRERGGFSSLEELEEIPGLPEGWVERARPFLTLADRGPEQAGPGDATMGAGRASSRGSEDGR